MNILCRTFLALSITALSAGAADLPDELVKKLSATLRELCPDAQIEISNSVFTAKHGTMMFTLHSTSKTGEVYPQTYQKEGPNFKGLVLTVSLKDGPYQGAAATPQTLQGPYFSTFIDAVATEGGDQHYWVTFSYGSRLDEKIRSEILQVIPKRKLQDSAANGSQPTRSTTSRTSSAAGSRR